MNPAQLERRYKALANRRRLQIIKFLADTADAPVIEIAGHIKLSFRSTSKHLQVLKQAGFLESEQVLTEQRYYLVSREESLIKQALNFL